MAVVHSFRLKNGDHELEKKLAGMTGREKSDFIREALDFYIRYGNKINKIDKISLGIQEILSKLDGISVGRSAGYVREEEKEELDNMDDEVLLESVQELLNL